jgi:hypothetical protein
VVVTVPMMVTAHAAFTSAQDTGMFRTNDGSHCEDGDISAIKTRGGALSLVMEDQRLVVVPAPLRIVVRWSPQVPLPGSGSEARRRAENILRQAGISVLWRECQSSTDSGRRLQPDCGEPLQANEVILRIVQAGSTGHESLSRASLGESLVDVAGCGGWFSTIYADRVTAMARLAGVGVTDVLACAVAHEIGHLLLGTRSHARRGLMRALWSAAEFRRHAALDWLFSADEARMMRATIARRVLESP